jgi:hypothetical protein
MQNAECRQVQCWKNSVWKEFQIWIDTLEWREILSIANRNPLFRILFPGVKDEAWDEVGGQEHSFGCTLHEVLHSRELKNFIQDGRRT